MDQADVLLLASAHSQMPDQSKETCAAGCTGEPDSRGGQHRRPRVPGYSTVLRQRQHSIYFRRASPLYPCTRKRAGAVGKAVATFVYKSAMTKTEPRRPQHRQFHPKTSSSNINSKQWPPFNMQPPCWCLVGPAL